jgi:hypothetical protein
MNEGHLVRAILDRISNPATRTDYSDRSQRDIGPPATSAVIEASERAIGCALHPLHRRLLQEVANGGFGPGDGLIGLPGGSLDVDRRSILELREILWLDADTPLPLPVVPLCDWGCAIYSCIDCETGAVLTISEHGLKDTGQQFHAWLEDWISGVDLWKRTVVLEDKVVVNPFTKQTQTVKVVAGTTGTPYLFRAQSAT